MNKSIKVLILIIILNLCFITGCASSNKDYNAIKIFDKVEPNSLFVEDFKEDFINSKFYNESYKEMVVECVVSEELFSLTNIGLFNVITDSFDLFIWHNGEIYNFNSFPFHTNNRVIEFSNFALGDLNNDNYDEFYFAYYYGTPEEVEDKISFSYVFCYDLKSNKFIESTTNYDSYLFFKANGKSLYVVESSKSELTEDYKLFFEIVPNLKKFEILKNEFTVKTTLYSANVYIENDYVDFPVFFDDFCGLYFNVRVEMTYLGETFSYVNGDTYLAGATASFNNGDFTIEQEPIAAGDAITKFTIFTNQVIDRTYYCYDNISNEIKLGTYDITISYKGVSTKVEDVIRFYY